MKNGDIETIQSEDDLSTNTDMKNELEANWPHIDDHWKNQEREKAGKMVGVSGRSVARAQTIRREGTEEDIKEVESGKKNYMEEEE